MFKWAKVPGSESLGALGFAFIFLSSKMASSTKQILTWIIIYCSMAELEKMEQNNWPLKPDNFMSLMLSYEIAEEYFAKRSHYKNHPQKSTGKTIFFECPQRSATQKTIQNSLILLYTRSCNKGTGQEKKTWLLER